MKAPNIFLHYWSTTDSVMTFQDILGLDVSPQILNSIQQEIQHQLNSEKLPELFPCFNWENDRFIEKWEAISNTLLLQVQLPNVVWENWIEDLQTELGIEESQPETISFNPFDDPVFGSFELNNLDNPLLSAEVYFEKREELEEMEERREKREERKEEREVLEERSEKKEERKEEREELEERREESEERREEREELEERREENEERNEIINEVPTVKNVLEQLQGSPEEKFFETISVTDSSLIKMVESKMTEQLSETISINQKIQFILQLFQGDAESFNTLISYIDQEADASNWQEELNKKYKNYQTAENQNAWKELYTLIQRKFN
ncbi:hypothetical protein V7S76_08130 [Aquirufa sp. ROCK2-A2]